MKEPKVLSMDMERGIGTLALDKGLYPLDVIYGAAYVLIDRAYILLDKDPDGRILVRIEQKPDERRGAEALTEEALRALVGEFGNELLSQALRRKITKQNQAILEAVVTQAMAGATGTLMTGGFEDEDDDLDFLDDPLGIAVPWEEKFSKENRKKKAEAEPSADDVADPSQAGGFKPTSGGQK
jgi:His-Xaa-Ser system protein HxsD